MKVRRTARVGWLILFGYSTFTLIAGVFVAESALHPIRRSISSSEESQAIELANSHNSELTNVSIAAEDGIALRAWSIKQRSGSGKTLLLLHGLSDNRMGMIGYAELLLNHGFDVLLPDSRAHGTSGGSLATYGLLESGDIERWVDWIARNNHPYCIFGFAESMGAAQLLQSLRMESNFCAVAAESPLSSFREVAYDRVGQFFHTGSWLGRTFLRPIVVTAFAYARWKYGLDFEKLSPELATAETRVPVLLIHGEEDGNIPVRHSRRIAARNRAVVLWEVRGADHCGAITAAPKEFERRLMQWLDNHANPTAPSQISQQVKIPPRPLHIAGNLIAQRID